MKFHGLWNEFLLESSAVLSGKASLDVFFYRWKELYLENILDTLNVSKGSIEIVLDSTVRKSLESELFGDSGCENLVSKNMNFKLSYLLKWYCKFESVSDKIAFDTDIESPKCILLTSRCGALGPVFFVGWNCARKTKFSDRKINRYVD